MQKLQREKTIYISWYFTHHHFSPWKLDLFLWTCSKKSKSCYKKMIPIGLANKHKDSQSCSLHFQGLQASGVQTNNLRTSRQVLWWEQSWEPRNSAFWSRHLSLHPFSLTYRCMCSSVSPRLATLLTLISCTRSLLFQRRKKLYSFVWLLSVEGLHLPTCLLQHLLPQADTDTL